MKSRLDPDFEVGPDYAARRIHGRIMIDRLVKLYAAGYRISVRHIAIGSELPLIHPDKRAPALALWDDGLVNDLSPAASTPDDQRNLFEPEDSASFDRFITRIPKPSRLQELGATPLGEVWSVCLAFILLVLIGWGITALLEAGFRAIMSG